MVTQPVTYQSINLQGIDVMTDQDSTTRGYVKHGMVTKNKQFYRHYIRMMDRCYNPNNARYSKYGAKGVIVYDGWKNNPQALLDHIGEKPSSKHTIDRIDNKGNYFPGNVKWSTAEEQAQNRSTTKLNAEMVIKMRMAYDSGQSIASIQREYAPNAVRGTIFHAVKRHTWKNIGDQS